MKDLALVTITSRMTAPIAGWSTVESEHGTYGICDCRAHNGRIRLKLQPGQKDSVTDALVSPTARGGPRPMPGVVLSLAMDASEAHVRAVFQQHVGIYKHWLPLV